MSHAQMVWETVYKKVPWKGCPYYSLTSFSDLLENQVSSFCSSLWPSSFFFPPPTSRGREKQSKGQAEMLRRLNDEGKDQEMEGDIVEIWTPGYFRRIRMVEGPSFLVGKSIAEIDNGLKKKPQLSRGACWHQIQGWSLKRMVSEKGWKINSWRTRTTSSLFDSE